MASKLCHLPPTNAENSENKCLVFSNKFLGYIEKKMDYSFFWEHKNATSLSSSDGNIRKLILQGGNGKFPPEGSRVFIEFVAYAEFDPHPFDSTRECGKPRSFILSKEDDTLRCLQLAVKSMEFHEVALFVSSPDYAYGSNGDPPRILPDNWVLLIIELLVEEEISAVKPVPMSCLTFRDIFDKAFVLNSAGISKSHVGDLNGAIACYSDGIKLLMEYKVETAIPGSDDESESDEDEKLNKKNYHEEMELLLYKMYSNMLGTYMRLGNPRKVVQIFRDELVTYQISMEDNRVLFNLAKAFIALKKPNTAVKVLKDAMKMKRKIGHSKIMQLKAQAEDMIIDKLMTRLESLKISESRPLLHNRNPISHLAKSPALIFNGTS